MEWTTPAGSFDILGAGDGTPRVFVVIGRLDLRASRIGVGHTVDDPPRFTLVPMREVDARLLSAFAMARQREMDDSQG